MPPIDTDLLKFVKVSDLPEDTTPLNGNIVIWDENTNKTSRTDITDFFQFLQNIALPLKPTDATPTTVGWYKPTTSGTYSNAGGLVVQDGYDTLFYFNGTTWTKTETKMPSVVVDSLFDEDSLNAQSGKGIFDYLTTLDETNDEYITVVHTKSSSLTSLTSDFGEGINNTDISNTLAIIDNFVTKGFEDNVLLTSVDVPKIYKVTANSNFSSSTVQGILGAFKIPLGLNKAKFGVWIQKSNFRGTFNPTVTFSKGSILTGVQAVTPATGSMALTNGTTITRTLDSYIVKFSITGEESGWSFLEIETIATNNADLCYIYPSTSLSTGSYFQANDVQRMINPICIVKPDVSLVVLEKYKDYNDITIGKLNTRKINASSIDNIDSIKESLKKSRDLKIGDIKLFNFSASPITGNAIISGDSTIANQDGATRISDILSFTGTKTDISTNGHTIAQQQTSWNAIPSATRTNANWVFVQIGLNDLNPSSSTNAGKVTELTNYINKIKSDSPSAKIILGNMLPCKQRLIDIYGSVNGLLAQERWEYINKAMDSISVTKVAKTHTWLLNDGNGNLDTQFDTGDHIHENLAGRKAIAYSWLISTL